MSFISVTKRSREAIAIAAITSLVGLTASTTAYTAGLHLDPVHQRQYF